MKNIFSLAPSAELQDEVLNEEFDEVMELARLNDLEHRIREDLDSLRVQRGNKYVQEFLKRYYLPF